MRGSPVAATSFPDVRFQFAVEHDHRVGVVVFGVFLLLPHLELHGRHDARNLAHKFLDCELAQVFHVFTLSEGTYAG